MNFFEGHDRFVRKNASLASGYSVKKSDDSLEKKGASHLSQGKEASCFSCKHKTKCRVFEKMRTGGSSGSVSYGGDRKGDNFLCEKYEIFKSQDVSINNKEIKSLLKNAMNGRI